MFGSIINLATSVVKVVSAPVEIVAELANKALKPVQEVLNDVKKDIKDA